MEIQFGDHVYVFSTHTVHKMDYVRHRVFDLGLDLATRIDERFCRLGSITLGGTSDLYLPPIPPAPF